MFRRLITGVSAALALIAAPCAIAQQQPAFWSYSIPVSGVSTATYPGNVDVTGTITQSGGILANCNSVLQNCFALNAGNLTMTGRNTTGLGSGALVSVTTGTQLTALGQAALNLDTTGSYNVAVGTSALGTNTTGLGNTAIGNGALGVAATDNYQTAVGDAALNFDTTGTFNNAFGTQALYANTTGSYNTGLGQDAMLANTTGSKNTVVGVDSLLSATVDTQSVAIGHGVAPNTTASNFDVLIGEAALGAATGTTTSNVIIGQTAMSTSVSSIGNTVIGYKSGGGLSNGNYNTIIGANISGLSGSLSNNVLLSDGQGNLRIQIDNSGNYKLGQDVASPTLTSLQIGNVAAGTSNTAGVNLNIIAGLSTGNQLGGAISFGSSNAGSSGSTQNSVQNIGTLNADATWQLPGRYSVSSLPVCNAGAKGKETWVGDATAPTFLGTLTGGGTVATPVFCNGSAWVSY